jgi:hypothetical protein
MIIFSAPSSSSSSFHQRYNYKIKKGRREKTREREIIIIHVKMFKNGRRKAASVTINEKINEDRIQYIAIYRFSMYVCVRALLLSLSL